jgi:hypothetical protein
LPGDCRDRRLELTGPRQWTESVVPPFEGPSDGGFSYKGMVVDRFGNFYGVTVHGGTDDDGCVYQVHALKQQQLRKFIQLLVESQKISVCNRV